MKKIYTATIISTFILVNDFLYASDEKIELNNVVIELKSLTKVIQYAEKSANPESRIQFDYRSLEHDLTEIQQGITDYINVVRRDPRQLPEINGDYKTNGD